MRRWGAFGRAVCVDFSVVVFLRVGLGIGVFCCVISAGRVSRRATGRGAFFGGVFCFFALYIGQSGISGGDFF